jgi:two-component system response regulator
VKKKTILLIEDNPDDQLLALRALKKNEIMNELIVAHDGEEALSLLSGSAERPPIELPAVILLDLSLPKMDGMEVLRQLRANNRTRFVPIVILTAYRDESDIFKVYRDGANSYIRKPVDFNEFTEAVKNIALYWLKLNEAPVS